MTRDDCIGAASAALDDGRFFAQLARRVAMRTESDSGGPIAPLRAYLDDELAPCLRALGFGCETIANPAGRGGPLLIARRIEDPSLPTVLTYGHGDVISGQDDRWSGGRSPWTLAVDGERWYGRGTADNKGQHTVNLLGLEAAIGARGGRLGYNVVALFETGEEAGSPGLREACEGHRDALRADLLIACDGPRVNAARPTLFLGSRGAVNFTLRHRARQRAYHSGNWGGVLANPATRLANALATMIGADGAILVDRLRPPPVSESIRRALAGVEVGGGADDPALDAGWGEAGLSAAERLFAWNALEVLAMQSGTPQRPVNAVPPDAVAHCQLRFVVGTPWERLAEIVREHLDAHGLTDIEIEVGMACAATRLDVDHPWVRWASGSIAHSTGQRPTILPNLAGSLPNDLFADLLGLPTLWVPHSYPACAQHAPDEHLLVPVVREGLRAMAGLYWDLGEPDAPWRVPT